MAALAADTRDGEDDERDADRGSSDREEGHKEGDGRYEGACETAGQRCESEIIWNTVDEAGEWTKPRRGRGSDAADRRWTLCREARGGRSSARRGGCLRRRARSGAGAPAVSSSRRGRVGCRRDDGAGQRSLDGEFSGRPAGLLRVHGCGRDRSLPDLALGVEEASGCETR